MRLKSSQSIEFRRETIIHLHQAGKTQSEIATLVQLDQSQVSIFLKAYRTSGQSAIAVKKAKGNQAALSATDLLELKDLLQQGAPSHGYEGNYWNRSRVKALIQRRWKVSYTDRHVGSILKKIGYTLQRFSVKDFRQSAQDVQVFLENTVPEIKKSPR
jgi:transposase